MNTTTVDYRLLQTLLKMSEKDLHQFLYSYLQKRQYTKIIAKDEYIIAEGTIPIALVAHLDTVYNTPPKHIFCDKEQQVMWSPEGLGADDRAGVYAIIQIIQSGLHPHIIFTNYEEIGAIGAETLVKEIPIPPNINYIIQLDRRGSTDCVFYSCYNQSFIEYVERFGFIENFGSFSDISEICPGWGIAGVNLSIGYENEHSASETLFLTHMINTIQKVKSMLQEKDIPFFEYIGAPSILPKNQQQFIQCNGKCNLWYYEQDLMMVEGPDKKIKYYCPECCATILEWCNTCGHLYDTDKCPYCEAGEKNDGLFDDSTAIQ